MEEQVRSLYHLYLRSLRSIKRLQEATPDGEVAPLGKSLKALWDQWTGKVKLCNFYHLQHVRFSKYSLLRPESAVNNEENEY